MGDFEDTFGSAGMSDGGVSITDGYSRDYNQNKTNDVRNLKQSTFNLYADQLNKDDFSAIKLVAIELAKVGIKHRITRNDEKGYNIEIWDNDLYW
ncbi:hypothetical protein AB4140_02195 [Shewanella sp. 10N.286.51.B2]|uniref:hypothetical protein n=1 Tax=Shewanella sp. 10N.286.51.B2 TaxID=3229707 RepID=UPI00354E64CB